MPKREQQTQPNEQKAVPLSRPESCLACRSQEVACFPVHLTELDGKVTLVCHVARCVNCGYIKNYGLHKGIFKLSGSKPDFKMQYWPELRRNGITPDQFVEAVCEASRDKNRTIWLDARKGLKQAEPEEKYNAALKRLEGMINRNSWNFTRGF